MQLLTYDKQKAVYNYIESLLAFLSLYDFCVPVFGVDAELLMVSVPTVLDESGVGICWRWSG